MTIPMDEGEMRLLDVLRRIGSGEGFPYVTAEEKLAAIQTYAQAQVADVDGQCQMRRPSSDDPVPSSPSQAVLEEALEIARVIDQWATNNITEWNRAASPLENEILPNDVILLARALLSRYRATPPTDQK